LRVYLDRPVKDLLLVHEPGLARDALAELLALGGVDLTAVASLPAALSRLRAIRTDCIVLGIDMTEEDLDAFADHIVRTEGSRDIPLIVYGHSHVSQRLEATLKSFSPDVTVRFVASPERLLDQSALLLHRPVSAMSERQREILDGLHHSNRALAGRKALIVDDDIRNIFALTAILEGHEMNIASAETGRDAIDLLNELDDVDVVLMDIMMPEMDGFETTRAIRANPRFSDLPIIAVTAKAMKGDREKCIDAGASDYLSKPVDPEELVAKLRAWLLR
ncbi:MAG TPA: response regulator, partial [Candidatus Limnocylindrales bacterium]|nr:response regulator [Candidatus Limnocylindrales bacterium]